jgi:hypothetical protein
MVTRVSRPHARSAVVAEDRKGLLAVRKLPLLIVVALALLAVPAAASAACGPGWRVAKRLAAGDTLYAVSWLPRGAWAVGWRSEGGPLIMRYDGSRWSEVPAPRDAEIAQMYPGASQAALLLIGVFARSASDVWAVGRLGNQALVLRWNGSAWRVVPNPGENAVLMDVVASSRDNAWAVGYRRDPNTGEQPFAMHWDGMSWTKSAGTEAGYYGRLRAAARPPGSSSLWTVGWDGLGTDDGALIERHRAGTWTHMFPAVPGLDDITAVAWNDVWAVGIYDHNDPGGAATAVHWNGKRWSVVPTPSEPGSSRDLMGVSAVSASNVWAVGGEWKNGTAEALIEHWDGNAWSVVSAPAGIDRGLLDVSMGRYGYGWAVGYGVILRYCPG